MSRDLLLTIVLVIFSTVMAFFILSNLSVEEVVEVRETISTPKIGEHCPVEHEVLED